MSAQPPRPPKPSTPTDRPVNPPAPQAAPRRPPVAGPPPRRPPVASAPSARSPVASPPPSRSAPPARPAQSARPSQTSRSSYPATPRRSSAQQGGGRRTDYAPPSNNRLPLIVGGGVVVILLVLVVVFIATSGKSPAAVIPPTVAPSASGVDVATMAPAATPANTVAAVAGPTTIPGEISIAISDRSHTADPITYKEVPPMGGAHWSDWMNCGIYDQPIQNERGVHSLEHGAVWITYQPTLAKDQVEILRGIIRQAGYRLLSPYPNLPHPVVASAWGYQLPLERADDPRLLQFVQKHQQDPQGPEPGASCSDGFGTPLP